MKKNFFATLIIAALIVVMSFSLTSCDIFDRGHNNSGTNGTDSGENGDGRGSEDEVGSPDTLNNEKKAALLEAIAQSIYEQENFEYNETATVPQNISSDLYDKIDEENNNTKFLGAAKFFGIMLASFLELTSDVYSNTNVAIEDNKILKLIADFIEFEDLEFLIMPVFKSGNIISLDWMLLESDGMCINYYYMEVEYDPETLEAVTYEILGMFGILKSNGEYYFAGSGVCG